MKILFDHQIYNNQNYGGISRYFYELSKGVKTFGVEIQNSISFSENEFTKDKQLFKTRQLPEFKGKGRLKKFFNQSISERIIKKNNYDIFHPTYYDTYYLDKSLLKRPLIVTFYDLIHEKFAAKYPDHLTNSEQELSHRKVLLKNASKVIAISQSTKEDIMEYYGTSESKIEVTHLASSLKTENTKVNVSLGKYILFVGNRSAYKNFITFVKAASPIMHEDSELKILCAGGGKFTTDESHLFTKLGIMNRVVHQSINDDILSELYFNAQCFIFPSLYEGFGIPALEAFSCNCPTILSNVSSLPEVGDDAALYIDPESQDDIASKLRLFLNSTELREEYKIKGLKQAQKFSWNSLASQTHEIYKSVI